MPKNGKNITCICIATIIALTAVSVSALLMGYDDVLTKASFTAIGAVPGIVIAKMIFTKPPEDKQ